VDWEAEGFLDGLDDERARAARRHLLDELHADGVPLEELRRACAEERLALLPVERLLRSEARYSARQIADETGLDLDFFLAHRRALGLAVPLPDECVYGEPDLEAARMGVTFRDAGFPEDQALEVARVLGIGMARYAEAMRTLVGQTFITAGTDERELGHRLEEVSRALLPMAGPWLEHVFALHLREVLRHDVVTHEQLTTGRLDAAQDTAVAFADLVGFTALGESVPVEELGGVAERLARLARDPI
jgi:adenylate cyclase